jgi:hypothetical protein
MTPNSINRRKSAAKAQVDFGVSFCLRMGLAGGPVKRKANHLQHREENPAGAKGCADGGTIARAKAQVS